MITTAAPAGRTSWRRYVMACLLPTVLSVPAFSQCTWTWYEDADGDGFGISSAMLTTDCGDMPATGSYVSNQLDCNDQSVNVAAWKIVGSGGFSPGAVTNTKLVVGPDGAPMVMYRHYVDPVTDPTGTQAPIGVRKYNGTAWTSLGADPVSTDKMYGADIAVDHNNVVYISYLDYDAAVPANNRVTVMRYNNITALWEPVGARRFSPVLPGDAEVNMVTDGNNVPYVIFSNASFQTTVMKFDAPSSNWLVVGAADFANVGSSNSKLAVDGNDHLYAAIADQATGGEITVMYFDGAAWSVLGSANFSDNFVEAFDVAVDDNNTPYVVYFDGGTFEVVVQKYDQAVSDWVRVGAAVFSGFSSECVLAIDKLGVPYVVYRDDLTLLMTVKKWNGTAWTVVADSEFALALNLSIAIAPDNSPYVSYKDLTDGDLAKVRMVAPSFSAPTALAPTASQVPICRDDNTTLNINSASLLRDATRWQWYSGSCGGTPVGTGASIQVSPTATTTYYVRGEGDCISVPGVCTSLPVTVNQLPVITTQPVASVVRCEEEDAVFEVDATGTGLAYQWYADRNDGGGFTMLAAETARTITLSDVSPAMNNYTYRVAVRNTSTNCTSASADAVLIVNPLPVIATQPAASVVRCEEDDAVFDVDAPGAGLAYQWYVDRNDGGGPTALVTETTRTLNQLDVTAAMNNYTYRVTVENTTTHCVSASSHAVLTVNPLPVIATPPAAAEHCAGEDAVFDVDAPGAGLTYQWYADRNDGSGSTILAAETARTLTLQDVTAAMNNYIYHVTVRNAATSCVSASAGAVLTINPNPVIVAQPVATVALCESSTMNLDVVAGGTFTYQWYENNGSGWSALALHTASALVLPGITAGMDGYQYRVEVSDPATGCTTFSAASALSVNERPAITLQPEGVVTCAGSEAGFAAAADGTAPTFQWQVNNGGGWADLPGETSASLLLNAVTAAMNNYLYRVVISDAGCEAAVSDEIALTVNTDPGTPGCPLGLLISEGVSPNGDGRLDYWQIDGIEVYPANRVKLYNIWGDLVFERQGYGNDAHAWRGESQGNTRLSGNQAPDGTYYYLIDLGNDTPLLKGFVVLKR